MDQQKNNEISTEIRKMNIFQKMRLNIFKKRFKVSDNMMERYNNAPDYIKNNEDVIDTIIEGVIVECIKWNDTIKCPKAIILERLGERTDDELNDIFENLQLEQKLEIIKKQNELSKRLSQKQRMSIFTQLIQNENYEDTQFIDFKKNEEEEAIQLLKKEYEDKFEDILKKILKYLSNTTITNIVMEKKELVGSLTDEKQKNFLREYVSAYGGKIPLKYFSPKIQEEYVKEHPDFFTKMSEELQRKHVGKDKLKISKMSEMLQTKTVLEDAKNIRYVNKNIFLNNIRNYARNLDVETTKEMMVHSKMLDAIGCLCKKEFHNSNKGQKLGHIAIFPRDQFLNEDNIKELIEIDNNYVLSYVFPFPTPTTMGTMGSRCVIEDSVQKCKNLFEGLYGKDKLKIFSKSIEDIFERCKQWYEKQDTEEIPLAELKILFNDDIMKKCDTNTILKFFDEKKNGKDGKENFREIINKSYGEKAKEILEKRSNLDVYNINSLEIFDSRILDNFPMGFVNDLISYNIKGFSAFLDIIKNPNKLNNFIDYYGILSEIMGKNVVTMEKSFCEFDYVEELLDNIKGKDLNNQQYKNLICVLCSKENTCNISNLEELDNFEQIANKYLSNRLRQTKNARDYSTAILEEYLGITRHDAEDFTKLFNIAPAELKKSMCTESETCLLNTLKFLLDNNDTHALQELAKEIMNTQGMRNPIALYTGINKVRDKQMEIFNSNFLTKEQMDERISDLNSDFGRDVSKLDERKKELPIYKYTDKNGIEHYCLNGIPFSCLSTKIGLSDKNADDEDRIRRFLEYDGQRGASTISTSFVKRWNREYEIFAAIPIRRVYICTTSR